MYLNIKHTRAYKSIKIDKTKNVKLMSENRFKIRDSCQFIVHRLGGLNSNKDTTEHFATVKIKNNLK